MTARLAVSLGLALLLVALLGGCAGSPDNGNIGTIQGEETGAGSHGGIADWNEGGASHYDHGAGHYDH